MAEWKYKLDFSFIDVFKDYRNREIQELGRKAAEAIRNLPEGMSSVMQKQFADRFEKCRSVSAFDRVLSDLYDYCDEHRIWIRTIV